MPLLAAPASLTFTAAAGATPPSQPVQLSSTNQSISFTTSAMVSTPAGGQWLSVKPSSGSSPATLTVNVTPGSLAPGSYTGAISITSAGASNSPLSVPVTLSITSAVPTVTAVVGAASFTTGVTPGGLASLFGTLLANGTAGASSFPLPSTLAGATVTLNGETAPLLYASAGQINLQIPVDLKPGAATAVVTNGGLSSLPFPFEVAEVAPSIFLIPGGSHAAAQNVDFRANSSAQPTPAGQPILLYPTGGGAVSPPVLTGQAAPANPLSRLQASVQVTIGGSPATVLFAGLAPGFAGLTQINAVVPAALAAGDQPVIVTIGGVPSNMASVSVGVPAP